MPIKLLIILGGSGGAAAAAIENQPADPLRDEPGDDQDPVPVVAMEVAD